MSAIRRGLESLDAAVSELENVVSALEQAGDLKQGDMFPDAKAAIVKSLDNMIDHVENMVQKAD